MTTKGAQFLKAAQIDGRTVEETLANLHQRNSQLDWDVVTMLPEVSDRYRNDHRSRQTTNCSSCSFSIVTYG